MQALRTQCSILCLAASRLIAPRAQAVDFTDIWYNPAENGWGVNVVQSDTFIFATFFVYGSTNQPTWFTALLSLNNAGDQFVGSVYASTGSWFGAVPYNAALFTPIQVGTATFQPTSSQTARLTYNIGTTTVTKTIQRQTLTQIALGGSYLGGVVAETTECANPANAGVFAAPVRLTATHFADNQFSLAVTLADESTCTLSGTLQQAGQLYHTENGTYSCGAAGSPAIIYDVKATSVGIEGQWAAPVTISGSRCVEFGRFAGVIR